MAEPAQLDWREHLIMDLKDQIERMKLVIRESRLTRNIAEDRSADLERRLSKAYAALEQITRECDGLNKGPVAVQIALEALNQANKT